MVFVPKRRRKAIFGQTRHELGAIFHALARQKECQIIEGHLMPDHVPMCIAIPPKHPVASVIGFLNGKSAIAIARLYGKERNFSGEHFWARGYAVSTVGFELEQVRAYIREQELARRLGSWPTAFEVAQLIKPPAPRGVSDWSPDGEKLAFVGFEGGEAEFWFMEDFLPLLKK